MIRSVLRLASAFGLLASGLPAAAQVAHDGQLWINTTLFGGVDAFAYFAEIQPRFGDGISRLDQLILRPAVGWKINDQLTIYQGYAYVETAPLGQPPLTEDRSFQQLSWEVGEWQRVKISSRTRFEQRWQSNGRDVGFRIREQLRASYPLTMDEGGIAALGWTEAFFALNDTDWGARAGFDRARTFIGLEIPFAGKSAVEIGYINQTVNAPGTRGEMDHIVSLNLFVRQ
ncbi:DUF2490 domain-containing protein [Methylobacterium radiodurans]|uniref:DUF2490 domain-containing protein n=1 Tax=Methylobacterium radiodurans TaxID=2202828 RepID=UPI001FE90173|nr:DUF2490 domain-containing protein [Methylobacterium radiodurans]